MAKIEISWTETVTETFHAVVDYDEFTEALEGTGIHIPTLEEIKAPGADNSPIADLLGESYGDWDEYVADLNDRDPDSASVENRDVESIKVIED